MGKQKLIYHKKKNLEMVELCVGNGNGWLVRKQTSFFDNLKVPRENPASQRRNPCQRERGEREERDRWNLEFGEEEKPKMIKE